MRLVDFLILLLQAHAETLRRLAALLGEDVLVHALENSPDTESVQITVPSKQRLESFSVPRKEKTLTDLVRRGAEPPPIYQELEGAIRELNLPPIVEFYLWAYPLYRVYIESAIDLRHVLASPPDGLALTLVDEAVEQAKLWTRKLQVEPEYSLRIEQVAKTPWLKFRTDVLKKLGSRPMQAVNVK